MQGLILAGGHNRRMNGQKKIFMDFHGEPLYSRLNKAMQPFCQTVYLSVDESAPYMMCGMPLIVDEIKDEGPLAAIYSGLKKIETDALLVVAGDLPFMDEQTLSIMIAAYQQTGKTIVAQAGHRLQPLAAIYPRCVFEIIEQELANGQRKIMRVLDKLDIYSVYFPENWPAFYNMNSPEVYRALLYKDIPYIYAVSGYKNSGKTTVLAALIPELKKRGYQTGIIKHDGHDFVADHEQTDTARLKAAGAEATIIYSEQRIMLHRTQKGPKLYDLINMLKDVDIILIEGLKNSSYDKYICTYPVKPNRSAKELADEIEENMKILTELKRRCGCENAR